MMESSEQPPYCSSDPEDCSEGEGVASYEDYRSSNYVPLNQNNQIMMESSEQPPYCSSDPEDCSEGEGVASYEDYRSPNYVPLNQNNQIMMESSEQPPYCSSDPEDCFEGEGVASYEDYRSPNYVPLNQNNQIMMESSEQPPYCSSDPEDCSEGEGVASYEDYRSSNNVPLNQNNQKNEEILRYLDNNPALVLSNSQSIPLNGEGLTFAQNSEKGVVVLFNNMQASCIEHALSQKSSLNANNNSASAMQYDLNDIETRSTEGISDGRNGFQNIDKNITASKTEALLEQEGPRQLVFITSKPVVVPVTDSSGFYVFEGNIRPATVTLKPSDEKEIESASEEPSILSPTYFDSYSCENEDGVGAVNITDDGLLEECGASVVETSLPTMGTAAPLFDPEWRTKNTLDEKLTEENDLSKLALPTKSPDITYFEFSDSKESLDSESLSESPLIEESSNHFEMGASEFPKKNDNANLTSIVQETKDEDNIENFHLPSRLQSSGSTNDDSKDSVVFDQSPNLDNILLKKMKLIKPSEVKDKNVYNLQTFSSNLEPEFSDNSSLDRECYDSVSPIEAVDTSKDIHLLNSNLEGATGNLRLQGLLTAFTDNSKLDKNLTDGKSTETYHDNLQYSLDQDPQHKEEHSSSEIAKSTPVKFCENNQNSVFRETYLTNENTIDNENSLSVKKSVNIDNKSQEDTIIGLVSDAFDWVAVKPPQKTYARKKKVGKIEFFCDDIYDTVSNSKQILNDEENLPDEDGYVNIFPTNIRIRISSIPVDESSKSLRPESSDQNLLESSDFAMDAEKSVGENTFGASIDYECKENDSILSNVAISDKPNIKAPQHTYARRKKTCISGRNMEFSDSPNNEQCSTPKTLCLVDSADEDGYANLLPSNIKIRISSPVDESAINLRPESSDQTLEEVPHIHMEHEDLENICGTYLMNPLLKTACAKTTEKVVPSASSPDFPKVASPKKKIQTLSSAAKKCPKIYSKKSSQVLDKVTESSSIEIKNASFDNRKIGKEVKIKKSKNFSCSSFTMFHSKKCPLRKGGLNWGKTAKTSGYRFKYNCSDCDFGSDRVNNLIAHMKHCCHKASSNIKDHHTDDIKKQQYPYFITSNPLASCKNFANGSVINNQYTVNLPTTSKVLHMPSDDELKSVFTKQHYHQ